MASHGPIAAIVGLGGVTGIALCCLRPMVIALLPRHLVDPAQLLATNSVAALVDNVSTLVGPLLAAAALATVGPPIALWISTGLLVASAVYVRSLSPVAEEEREQPDGTRPSTPGSSNSPAGSRSSS